MDEQVIFNWIIAAFGTVLGFILKTIWNAVKDLQRADTILVDKVNHIEVLVAGQYVSRYDFDKVMGRLLTKLDTIENKIDMKADK